MHRPAPLPWIPAFAGTTMGALARGVRVRVGDAPPRAPALDSRFRGNDDGGVGARGSCQGGGCTAPRPCPGFPLSRERRWGRWREGFVSGWGMHRPAPLPWIPAFAGTTMGALARGVRVRVGDAPPRAPALDSRFRGNDDGGVGARGSCQGGGCTAPRPCPGFPLSRERRWGRWRRGARVRVGEPPRAPARIREGRLPALVPLSRERDGGVARGVRVRVGNAPPRAPAWIPAFAGTTMGAGEGLVSGWGMHRPAPLPWIPAFAGTTMGECGFGSAPAVALRGVGTGRPPSGRALREPQDGLRAKGFGEREACDGI